MTAENQKLAGTVSNLVKVTLSYIIEEDRVQLVGEDASGETMKLWFTGKLLLRLVPHLVTRHTNFDVTHIPIGHDISDSGRKSVDEGAAVVCRPGDAEALIAAVNVTAASDHLSLIFKDMLGIECASLALSPEALKEWIQGLKLCFQHAGWAQEVFTQAVVAPYKKTTAAVTLH